MKKLLYLLYAFFFNISRIFPVNENKVSFVSMHNANFKDSLKYVYEEFKKHDGKFKYNFISRRDCSLDEAIGFSGKMKAVSRILGFFTVKAYNLATSKYIFLNDNFMPLANLNVSGKTKIVQLWHAEGAFKKFGLDMYQPPKIRKREIRGNGKLSYVVVSSKAVAPIYAGAFGIDESRVLPLGSPRTDYFFKDIDKEALRRGFDEKYMQAKNKKLVLYAPTFRDNPEEDKKILDNFDFRLFGEKLGNEYCLLVRLHPQVHFSRDFSGDFINLTDYPDVNELVILSDILISDYSSIVMDFALLGKPSVLFAYDLEEYKNSSRDFYFKYEDYVPGPIARTTEEIIKIIETGKFSDERIKKFTDFNHDFRDGKSAERVYKYITENDN